MTRSLPRPTISTVWLLFGACAFGFVLGLVLLVAHSRPASALEIPQIDAPKVDVAGVVHDPVGTVTEVAPKVPLPEAAARQAENPGPAADTPGPPPPAPQAPVALPQVALPQVALNQVLPVPASAAPLPSVQLPAVDLGRVDPTASDGLSMTRPSIDLGSIDPGLGGVLPAITLPRADLGGVSGGHVGLPVVAIASPPSLAPTLPHSPADLGGAARRLQAPTDAPFPLIPSGAPAPPPPSAASVAVSSTDAWTSTHTGHGRAATTRAVDGTPASSAPYDAAPADAPAAPTSSPSSSSPLDPGGTRAPTFVFTFAVLLATIALGHDLRRRIALLDQLPTSQFLTVLIERPG